jgi:hypothetical protein
LLKQVDIGHSGLPSSRIRSPAASSPPRTSPTQNSEEPKLSLDVEDIKIDRAGRTSKSSQHTSKLAWTNVQPVGGQRCRERICLPSFARAAWDRRSVRPPGRGRDAPRRGPQRLLASPHLRSDLPGVRVIELADRCKQLQETMAPEQIEIRLVTRAEVSLVWAREARDHELAPASYDQHGTDLLIETPSASVAAVDSLLYGLRRGSGSPLPTRSTMSSSSATRRSS